MRCNIFNSVLNAVGLLGIGMAAICSADVAQQPLSLTESVPPNMIFTLDDSGSMRWAFAPDSMSADRTTRRAKSSSYNPLYYDPAITYTAPKIIDPSGVEVELPTSFAAAYNNGFDTSHGSLNLSNNGYKVSWTYDPVAANLTSTPNSNLPTGYGFSSTTPYLAENPGINSFCSVTSLSSNNASKTCTVAGYTVTITRTGTSSCTVTAPIGWPSGTCSGSSGTYIAGWATATLPSSYANDFSCTVTGLANGDNKTCTVAGKTATIARSSDGATCTVTAPTGWANGTCSGSYGTYTASWAKAAVPAYYYVHNGVESCAKNDDSCYLLKLVTSSEQQNFANWYSFYRNRALATLSAASLAFYDLSPSLRVTWQGLGNCESPNGSDTLNCENNKFNEFSSSHKSQFYTWLRKIKFDQSTYLPAALWRAGEFLKTDPAWLKYPQSAKNASNPLYACRPSYHIAMTDGMWNATTADPGNYQQDQTNPINLPDGKQYTGQRPFYDATAKTLADLAMHYWATDLRSDIDNGLKAYLPFKNEVDAGAQYWDPRNDPATWQHMVNFTIGLGLTQSLNKTDVPWKGDTFTGVGYENLKSGTANWPAASSGSNNNVYDLWHTAINSRGEFFSVDEPDAMVLAFKTILSRIEERNGSTARPAINSGQIEDAGAGKDEKIVSYSYQTYFDSGSWSGDIQAFTKRAEINSTTGKLELVFDPTKPDWSAKKELDARTSARNIKIAGSGPTKLQDFTWINAGSFGTANTLANLLKNDPDKVSAPCDTADCAEKRLNFLRGSTSDEGGLFRDRKSILGDILNSVPASVRGARYLVSQANKIEGNTKYQKFYEDQEVRAKNKPRIYVGANDGMLHAFNANTGEETFAFIPTAVFPNLYKLTGKTYSHQYYVDGSPVVADAYLSDEWRTVLIGTLRGGGKGLFALDITDPDNISLLWEFSDSNIPAIDGTKNQVRLGYTFPQPTVARLHNGKWAVVTGNGYDSTGNTHGKAGLLVIDLESGGLIKNIEVQGTTGIANGLSTPKLADRNVDGVADYAYAGDLQGNLWRFNLTPPVAEEGDPVFTPPDSTDTDEYLIPSYGGKPLFKAVASSGQNQSITAAPSIVRHPSRSGYLIIFGTGKYFETTDKSGTVESQSVYAIWDTNADSTSGTEKGPGSLAAGTLTRARLQEQTYEKLSTDMRTLTQNAVKWAVPPSSSGGTWADSAADGYKFGWYFDLKGSDPTKPTASAGEMMVDNMVVLGQTLFLQTLVPNDDPCKAGAESWTYAINATTGGRPRHFAFVNLRDPSDPKKPITTYKQKGIGGLTPTLSPNGVWEICTGEVCVPVAPDPESVGRQSWRQVDAK